MAADPSIASANIRSWRCAGARTKSFTMSVASGKGLPKLREEAKKCVLVCANCHGEIESGLIESPPAGTISSRP